MISSGLAAEDQEDIAMVPDGAGGARRGRNDVRRGGSRPAHVLVDRVDDPLAVGVGVNRAQKCPPNPEGFPSPVLKAGHLSHRQLVMEFERS